MKEEYQNKFVDIWGHLPILRTAIKSRMNIMLRGPTGTGKTYLLNELSKEYGFPMLVTNMTAGYGTEEIKGRYVMQPGEDGKPVVKWIDGQLVTAMKKGYWIVIEEANFMPEELASVLYSVMDDRKNIILEEHENEVIEAHPNFRLFLTANWGYKGTVIPNDAIRNRIDVYFDLSYLPEKEEAKLIVRETVVDNKIAKLISKFAWRQRKIKSRHTPDISTRVLIRWATLIKHGLNPADAGEHTIVSLMFHDEKEKEKIREAMKFEFEAIEEEEKEVVRRKTKAEVRLKTKSGDIEVEDLVSISKGGMKFYGKVTRITKSKKGDKVWAMWNENREEAIRSIASSILPVESADYVSRVVKEEE